MALVVKSIVNNSDAELDVIDMAQKTVEKVDPNTTKAGPDKNLLDLTFVSQTGRPIYIRIKSIVGDGDIGDDDGDVEVITGDPEQEEFPS